MLASHRDQENRLLNHQLSSKQQPKTPRARNPKTPLGRTRNDENAGAAFAGKGVIEGGPAIGRKDILNDKEFGIRQTISTPMTTRARAPLGNKTTNAKAKAAQGQGIGVKGIVKDIEKTQAMQNPVPNPKSKPAELLPRNIALESLDPDFEEPEYGPLPPKALSYQSDVFPEGCLTFEGLRTDNLMRGYYGYFNNPVDDSGISRVDKQFDDEMTHVLANAVLRNDAEANQLMWHTVDIANEPVITRKELPNRQKSRKHLPDSRAIEAQYRHAPKTSRSAASTMKMRPGKACIMEQYGTPRFADTKTPLSLAPRGRAHRSCLGATNLVGGVASRTAIGYKKGGSALSILHSQPENSHARSRGHFNPITRHPKDDDSQVMINPTQPRKSATKTSTLEYDNLPFLLFFAGADIAGDQDDGCLPPINIPFQDGDEEEEFELKLEIGDFRL